MHDPGHGHGGEGEAGRAAKISFLALSRGTELQGKKVSG